MDKLSYNIDLQTYKEDSKQEFLPWDEKMDWIIMWWDSERFYTANQTKPWNTTKHTDLKRRIK